LPTAGPESFPAGQANKRTAYLRSINPQKPAAALLQLFPPCTGQQIASPVNRLSSLPLFIAQAVSMEYIS
jgi:hypothetical protein